MKQYIRIAIDGSYLLDCRNIEVQWAWHLAARLDARSDLTTLILF